MDTEEANRNTADWACWVTLAEHIELLQTSLIRKFPRHAPALNDKPKNFATGNAMNWPSLIFHQQDGQHFGWSAKIPARRSVGSTFPNLVIDSNESSEVLHEESND